MVGIFRQPLTADDVKRKARELGADLVGIADGELMNLSSAGSCRSAPADRHHRA